MDNSTPPKASTGSDSSPPSIPPWLFLTPENASTIHHEGPADPSIQTGDLHPGYGGRSHASSVASTFMIHRLFDVDNEDNGASPTDIPTKDNKSVDSTIRLVTPANGSVSEDTPNSSRKAALRVRTSMVNASSSSLGHVKPGPGTGPHSPSPCVSPLAGYSKRCGNAGDRRDHIDEHGAGLEGEHSPQNAPEDLEEGSYEKLSSKSRRRGIFRSKVTKAFGLVSRFRNLWK